MPGGKRKRSSSAEDITASDEPDNKINVKAKEIQEQSETIGIFQSESTTQSFSVREVQRQRDQIQERIEYALYFLKHLGDSKENKFVSTIWHYLHTNLSDPEKFFRKDVNFMIFDILSVLLKKLTRETEDANYFLIFAKEIDELSDYFGGEYRKSEIQNNPRAKACFKYLIILYNLIEGEKHLLKRKAVKFCVNKKAFVTVDYDAMYDFYCHLLNNAVMHESTKEMTGISVLELTHNNHVILNMTSEFVKEIAKVTLNDSDKNIMFAMADDIEDLVKGAEIEIEKIVQENNKNREDKIKVFKLPPYTAQPVHVIFK